MITVQFQTAKAASFITQGKQNTVIVQRISLMSYEM